MIHFAEAYEREISNDSYVSGFNNWENGGSTIFIYI